MRLFWHLVFSLFLYGLHIATLADTLTPEQNAAIAEAVHVKGIKQISFSLDATERTVVLLGETHIMDPVFRGPSTRGLLNAFNLRGLEGFFCHSWSCEISALPYKGVLRAAYALGMGSSIYTSRDNGWYFSGKNQLFWNGHLVAVSNGEDFVFADGLYSTMTSEDIALLKSFAHRIHHWRNRIEVIPHKINGYEINEMAESVQWIFRLGGSARPDFNSETPISVDLEYGDISKYESDPRCTDSSIITARDCRMADNILRYLREFPEISVMLVQVGSFHLDGLSRLIADPQNRSLP